MANATNTIAGDIQLAGDLGGNNNAASPALTNTAVIPGSYIAPSITVDSKGRVTAVTTAPDATTSTKGVVQIGSGLSVTAGVVSLTTPQSDATTSTKGVVQIGSGLSVTAGVVSLATLPDATTSTKGVVQIGSGLSVTSGVLSLGTLPNATTSTKGVVQVGSGLAVTAGVLSLNAPLATTSTKGVVQVGSGLSVSGGIVSLATIADATTSVKGIVQIGAGLTVTAGVVALDTLQDATTSTKGVVQIGTNIDVTTGVISVADASGTTTKGVVKSANAANIAITAGVIDVGSNIPKLNTTNTFTKAQHSQPYALTSGTTIAVDGSQSNVYTLTIGHNATLSNPTNLGAGRYTFIITQDGTGSRTLAFGTSYKFATGADTTISTTANSVNIVTCTSNGTSLYCSLAKNFV